MTFGLLKRETKNRKKFNQSYYSVQRLKIKEKNTLVIALPPPALLWNFHILLKMYPALCKRKTHKYKKKVLTLFGRWMPASYCSLIRCGIITSSWNKWHTVIEQKKGTVLRPTLEYAAKLTSFYWLAVRNKNGTKIKRLCTPSGLNSTLFTLDLSKTTMWQLCFDVNIYFLGTHTFYILKKCTNSLITLTAVLAVGVDKELVLIKSRSETFQQCEEMLFVAWPYLVSLIRKRLQCLDLLHAIFHEHKRAVFVKW